jgi:hypothetical protein
LSGAPSPRAGYHGRAAAVFPRAAARERLAKDGLNERPSQKKKDATRGYNNFKKCCAYQAVNMASSRLATDYESRGAAVPRATESLKLALDEWSTLAACAAAAVALWRFTGEDAVRLSVRPNNVDVDVVAAPFSNQPADVMTVQRLLETAASPSGDDASSVTACINFASADPSSRCQMCAHSGITMATDGANVWLVYDAERFDGRTATSLLRTWRRAFIEIMKATGPMLVKDVPFLDDQDLHRIVNEWNRPVDGAFHAELNRNSLHELFAWRAQKSPKRAAIEGPGVHFTYAEVDELSKRLAKVLCHDYNVQSGHRVAIFLDRGPYVYIAMLGIMYSGAAYVPIDPTYPAARVHYTLNNSSSRLVVSNTSLLPQYQAEIQPHVELCHIFLIDEFIENPVR